jgi:hypothetical protein
MTTTTTRNPSGQQYKTRKGAANYAAKLDKAWGGEQSDGSTVEIVVDTIDTPEGTRYQVMCVTTRTEAPAPTLTAARVKKLRAAFTGQDLLLGSTEYRISGLDRRVYDHTQLDVYLERLNAAGRVESRTWTVLTPAELAAKVQ